MPIYQFKCDNDHEFEKLMQARNELHKWCTHCNRLTEWNQILELHHEHYKQTVCSECLGNKHIPPSKSTKDLKAKKEIQTTCPECGAKATHILRLEVRGRSVGGPGVGDSSVRFHFNYLGPSEGE